MALDPERRARIVLAATDLFSAYGYRRTSMDQLAHAAGVAAVAGKAGAAAAAVAPRQPMHASTRARPGQRVRKVARFRSGVGIRVPRSPVHGRWRRVARPGPAWPGR